MKSTSLLLASLGLASLGAASPALRLNSVGFLPDSPKRATVVSAQTNFSVVRVSDGSVVWRGSLQPARHNPDTAENVCVADFSGFAATGTFRLDVPDCERSAPFQISADVYQAPFRATMVGMYLWRCGVAVSAEYNGHRFSHAACHTNDAWFDAISGVHECINATGGWHDAGDYNKYVVNAGVSVGTLLRAWADFGPRLRQVRLPIPETGRVTPDFLSEVKWEIDWLLRMQAPDGSVYHKVSTRKFGGFIFPEAETQDRLLAPWSSAATANLAAVTAAAAREFQPYDPTFAARCEAAARRAYACLETNRENHPADLSAFSTGTYQVRDFDARLWAAAELWETTGDPRFLRDFESRARETDAVRFEARWDYGNVKNLGLLTYLFSHRIGRDPGLLERFRTNLVAVADGIVQASAAHGYARPLGTAYSWGGNGLVARQAVVLHAATRIVPKPEYRNTGLDALGYLFGRNVHGRSYVTGLGFEPPLHPHDRRRGAGDNLPAWPGYLVGGPNPGPRDWQDEQRDFRTNEIAINWNTALVYALAWFLPEPPA